MKNGFFFFFFSSLSFTFQLFFFFLFFFFSQTTPRLSCIKKKKNCKRNVFCYSLTAADSQADLRKRSFFSPFFLYLYVSVCVCVCVLHQAV